MADPRVLSARQEATAMLPPLPECLAGQRAVRHVPSAATRVRGEEKAGRVQLTRRVALVVRLAGHPPRPPRSAEGWAQPPLRSALRELRETDHKESQGLAPALLRMEKTDLATALPSPFPPRPRVFIPTLP